MYLAIKKWSVLNKNLPAAGEVITEYVLMCDRREIKRSIFEIVVRTEKEKLELMSESAALAEIESWNKPITYSDKDKIRLLENELGNHHKSMNIIKEKIKLMKATLSDKHTLRLMLDIDNSLLIGFNRLDIIGYIKLDGEVNILNKKEYRLLHRRWMEYGSNVAGLKISWRGGSYTICNGILSKVSISNGCIFDFKNGIPLKNSDSNVNHLCSGITAIGA